MNILDFAGHVVSGSQILNPAAAVGKTWFAECGGRVWLQDCSALLVQLRTFRTQALLKAQVSPGKPGGGAHFCGSGTHIGRQK